MQVAIELVFYLTLAYGVVRRRLDAIAGTVLVALGVRVALSCR